MSKILSNPMNLEYRYQWKIFPGGNKVFREGADPTMLLFKGHYYLFVSMSGGFWHSDDLYTWTFKETPELPIYDYAPDVCEVDGAVVFSASRHGEGCTFYRSYDPLNQPFAPIPTTIEVWDPALFQDDDGRAYLYWGCGNKEPLWGIEVDAKTFQPIGEKTAIIGENEASHGWERFGENNKLSEPKTEMEIMIRNYLGTKPFIEGAYITKHNNKYYFQYAAPGTEFNVYGNGVYIGDSPMGAFVYQSECPLALKPGGFITGAGHGSTFQDKHGNWWHIATMRISVNENFERRLGLFPCTFDADGVMHCNMNFSDYPYLLPDGARGDTAPQAMLLSYAKTSTASSSQEGHPPALGTNEDVRTWWAAKPDDQNPWYQLDLGKICAVQAVQVNFADAEVPIPELDQTQMHVEEQGNRLMLDRNHAIAFHLEGSSDKKNWTSLLDRQDGKTDYSHDFISFDQPKPLRYVRLSNMKLPFGAVPAISGLRVFGKGDGNVPAPVTSVIARREGDLNILLSWEASKDATGYNVRYGIAPDKLYNSWQLYDVTELDLSTINSGLTYYVAVDSYNENGVTSGRILQID